MSYRIAMIGAGSFFTDEICSGLCADPLFADSTFVLNDVDPTRLELAEGRCRKIADEKRAPLTIQATQDRAAALGGCDYVLTSCEKLRSAYWAKDNEIPAKHGVQQYLGENGGPGGQAHAMRNITMFMDICADIDSYCPDAWLMNFTNPMSFVCTYFHRHTNVKALGFCHQVHGSFGVIAEMLGMEPGELEVITGGINHFNWLLDIRLRGTGESYMDTFLERVQDNKYWQQNFPRIPEQRFTGEILRTFGLYCVGYDDHICEYTSFFPEPNEWPALGFHPRIDSLHEELTSQAETATATIGERRVAETKARAEFYEYPFPKDGHHPHYKENPVAVMSAFATNKPYYMPAIVIENKGAIDNLPADAVVDVPAVAVGGEVRSVNVGPLPMFAMELCRRQITIHELLTQATVEGDRQAVYQSMALDPYVRTIEQARRIADDFLDCYREELPQFWS